MENIQLLRTLNEKLRIYFVRVNSFERAALFSSAN